MSFPPIDNYKDLIIIMTLNNTLTKIPYQLV